MPKEVHHGLTPARVRQEKKPGRYADGNGLYLVVSDKGGRWWEWRGTVLGHNGRKIRGIGSARTISLTDARETAREWRRLAREGVDPKIERDKARRKPLTFKEAAEHVHAKQIKPRGRSEKYREQWLGTLEAYAFPVIGSLPIHAVKQADILKVLAPVWVQKPTTARLLRQRLRKVMSWARVSGHFEGINPVEGVDDALPDQPGKVQHHRALPYDEVPDLMCRLADMVEVSALAARFMILTAARSGEVRNATWGEIDQEGRVWRIPAERMKASEEHRVPLSDAALDVLKAAQELDKEQVFPSRKPGRPLSDAALSRLFTRLNVPGVPHGMRSTFRDWCEECTSFPHEVKEQALAHTVKNRVERAYRRTDLFEKRRQLMDQWGRFCMSGAEGGKVVELRA